MRSLLEAVAEILLATLAAALVLTVAIGIFRTIPEAVGAPCGDRVAGVEVRGST